jgi:hypothetical protein
LHLLSLQQIEVFVTVKVQSHSHKSNFNTKLIQNKHKLERLNGEICMSKIKKKPEPYFYTGETKPDPEETDDIYQSNEREEMLDDDEITAAENGFMMGREDEPPSKKETRRNAVSHDDDIAVELAKEDSEDD